MSNIIKKINKLNNTESFMQINTVRGFKYIDRAGEIINQYHTDGVVPSLEMNLDGLVISEPKNKMHELKITSQMIWAKFNEIDSLDMIEDLFFKESKAILKILDVDQINRIGWRNHFVFEFKNKEDQDEYFKKLTNFENGTLSIAGFEVDTKKDFSMNLIIKSVVKNDKHKIPGVLFDVDIFKSSEIKKEDILEVLNEFKDYLRGDSAFLSVLNSTFIKK